jgi:hypothetical protein
VAQGEGPEFKPQYHKKKKKKKKGWWEPCPAQKFEILSEKHCKLSWWKALCSSPSTEKRKKQTLRHKYVLLPYNRRMGPC